SALGAGEFDHEPGHRPGQQGECAEQDAHDEADRLEAATHQRTLLMALATATARSGAAALFWDAVNSGGGSEPGPGPAPAWTRAAPRGMGVAPTAVARSRSPAKAREPTTPP